MTEGSFTLRKNKSRETAITTTTNDYNPFKLDLQIEKQRLSYKYFNRGIYSKKQELNAKKIEFMKAKKMKRYDKFLRKFRYADALKNALTTKDTQIIVSLIEELIYRDGLDIAIKGLQIDEMAILLSFVYKKCDSANHQNLILYIFEAALGKLRDIEKYEDKEIGQILMKIREKLNREEEIAQEALEISGMVELMEAMA